MYLRSVKTTSNKKQMCHSVPGINAETVLKCITYNLIGERSRFKKSKSSPVDKINIKVIIKGSLQ